jgi:hypothetical protein
MANSHTQAQRAFIVRKLAAFEPPRSIVVDFCAVFPDTRCAEDDVRRVDPASGAVLSPELHDLYQKTREAVLLDPSSAPFANQQARMIALSKQAMFYSGNNQLAEMRAVLRQIAEEQGVVGGKGKEKAAGSAAATGTPDFKKIEVTRTVVDPVAVSE